MPATYRRIECAMWNHKWYKLQSPHVKLFWAFLLTNPCTETSGLYVFNELSVPALMGCPKRVVTACIQTVADAGQAVFEDGWVLIPTFIEHQQTPNPDMWKSVVKQIKRAPKSLRRQWLAHNGDRVPTGCREGLSIEVEVEVDVEVKVKKDPPPTSPPVEKSPVPLPKRVGGFFNRSGKDGQRQDFYSFIAEILSVTDVMTAKKGLRELNSTLADHNPTNIVAYAGPIFERHIGNWLQERGTQQREDGEDRRAAKELRDRLRQKQGAEKP